MTPRSARIPYVSSSLGIVIMDCQVKPGNDNGKAVRSYNENDRDKPGHFAVVYVRHHACEMNFVFI
jgi:hypothetical protein